MPRWIAISSPTANVMSKTDDQSAGAIEGAPVSDGAASEDQRKIAPVSSQDLRALALFRALSNEDLDYVFPSLESRRLKTRTVTLIDRDFPDQVGIAWSGEHRVVAVSPKGLSVTMFEV